jgi:ribosome-associated protein
MYIVNMSKIISSKKLLSTIIEGIEEKKGKNITSLDFKKIDNAICKYFVICEGDSTTHVAAISHSVEEYTQKKTGEKVWRTAGFENSEWVILDYADIMVHVFQPHVRNYYDIEGLWADCIIKNYSN